MTSAENWFNTDMHVPWNAGGVGVGVGVTVDTGFDVDVDTGATVVVAACVIHFWQRF